MDIKKLRKRLGMSQGELAEALGVERITVIRWESGDNKPSKLAQRQLARLERKGE